MRNNTVITVNGQELDDIERLTVLSALRLFANALEKSWPISGIETEEERKSYLKGFDGLIVKGID